MKTVEGVLSAAATRPGVPNDALDGSLRVDAYDVLGFRALVGGTSRATSAASEGSDTLAARDAHRAVRRVLRGFGPVTVDAAEPLPRYDLIDAGGGWQVRADGAIVHIDSDFAAALGSLEWNVMGAALAQRNDLVHLHGAALCAPTERAGIVFVGDSGAGKTTLTLALMLRGFAPFGDDVTLMRPDTEELVPFRRAFHTDETTWRVLEPLAGGPVPAANGPTGYFSPPQWAREPVPVRWLLVLDRRPGQAPHLVSLTPTEAAASILAHTIGFSRAPQRTLALCTRLTGRIACYRFVTGALLESAAVIQRLVLAAPPTG